MREGLSPVNPHYNDSEDSWGDVGGPERHGQGYGKGADTRNIGAEKAHQLQSEQTAIEARRKRQQELALEDTQKTEEAIRKVNEQIAAASQSAQIASVLKGQDTDTLVDDALREVAPPKEEKIEKTGS